MFKRLVLLPMLLAACTPDGGTVGAGTSMGLMNRTLTGAVTPSPAASPSPPRSSPGAASTAPSPAATPTPSPSPTPSPTPMPSPYTGPYVLTFIDQTTGQVAYYDAPTGIGLDPVTNQFYVAEQGGYLSRLTPAVVGRNHWNFEAFAGSLVAGYAEGLASGARFNVPMGLAVTADHRVLVADTGNQRIRVIQPDGTTSWVAGTGAAGYQDGDASVAQFHAPSGVCQGPDGVIYVVDCGNNCVRAISPTGQVSTFAGATSGGLVDGVGAAARFQAPIGIAMAPDGGLLIADTSNHCIRQIAADSTVTTVAGMGDPGYVNGDVGQARFDGPTGVAVLPNGDIVVADRGNHCLRVIHQQTVSTFAGGPVAGSRNGLPLAAQLASPFGVAVDASGDVVVTDTGGNRLRYYQQDTTP